MQAHAMQHINLYDVALQQYQRAVAYLDLPESIKTILQNPKRELHVTFPVQLRDGTLRIFSGYRVHHSTVLGPSQGGLRYAPAMELDDMRALAMWMSWKCALANLPYGGANGGVICDPRTLNTDDLERITRRYASEMSLFVSPHEDIAAPNIGTDEQTMMWIKETYTMVLGNTTPAIMTTPPTHPMHTIEQLEATGRGIVFAMDEALRRRDYHNPANIRVTIQGFGKIAAWVAQIAFDMGYTVIALSDSSGGITCPDGLDVDDVLTFTTESPDHTLSSYPHATPINNADLLTLDTDVLIPCAVENQITTANANDIRAFLVVEGADGPTTVEADDILNAKGVQVVPDILANAGSVIKSYLAWVQDMQSCAWSATNERHQLQRILGQAFDAVTRVQAKFDVTMRTAAQIVAIQRVSDAIRERGL